jgi:hypothetical protein
VVLDKYDCVAAAPGLITSLTTSSVTPTPQYATPENSQAGVDKTTTSELTTQIGNT